MDDRPKKKDLTELYDILQGQLMDDREKILDLYNSLKKEVTRSEDFAIHGLTLSKFAEIMIKQTGQLIDLIKINQGEIQKPDLDLDEEDKKVVFGKIGHA